MCAQAMRLSALQRNYLDIHSYASKAQHTPFKTDADQANLHAAYGLYYINCGRYKDAAQSFLQVRQQDLGPSFNDVMVPQDVALYGALCSLASLDRNEVQAK